MQAFVFIEAEPSRVQELVGELAGMQLAASVIKQVYAVTGRWDLIALIESPDLPSLGDWIANGIGNAVGVRHTETSLIVWSQEVAPVAAPVRAAKTPGQLLEPLFAADKFYDAGDKGCAFGPMDEIAALMGKMASGETLEINATDPSVAYDMAAWCRMTGNVLVEQRGDRYLIRKT